MKKRLFSYIFGLILVLSFGFVLVACDQSQTVDSIEIITPSSTLVYEEGAEFNCDGLTIKLKYTDGTYSEELELSNLIISSPDMESAGTKTINISYTYEGKTYTTTYSITVNEHVHLFNLEDTSVAYLKSEADCTHKAVYYKSCECGEIGKESFEYGEALGHDIVEHPAVAATCTEMGNIKYWACSRCNTCFSDELGETEIETVDYQIAPLGHTTEHFEAVDATCTHEGHLEYWKCSVCQKLYKESTCETETTLEELVKKQLDHSFDCEDTSVAYLKSEADCTHKAVYYKSCKCGEIGKDTFEHGEALGHNIVEHPAVAATCTKAGNIEYWACSRCNTCFRDELGETETTLEEVVEKQLNHSFDCSEDIRNKKCSVCNEDVIVLGYNSQTFNPNSYDLTYTVLANDGCIDTYHEKYKITALGTLQNNKSATIYSSSTYTGKYFVSFVGISGHPNGSSSGEVKFFMYVEDDTLKFQYTPVTGGIAQSIVDKMIDPRKVLYTGGSLYSTYSTQLQNGIIVPIENNSSTGDVKAFTIKISQFSDTPITTASDTTVTASLQRTDYTFIPLTKNERNPYKPDSWSYNEDAYFYTFCNYTNVSYYTEDVPQSFDEETGILTSYDTYQLQLYADLTSEFIDNSDTFQPSKEIFTGDPWGKKFTYEYDEMIYEEINFPSYLISTSYNLQKTYYTCTFWKFDCPEYIIEELSELVGDKTYTNGEGVGEFDFAKIYDIDCDDYIPIENISIVKFNDTFSLTYNKESENPITLTGTLSYKPYYSFFETEPEEFADPYIFFADFCFKTEDEQMVYLTFQWLYDPDAQILTPYCILVEIYLEN